jgi:hypothetical protein
LDGRNSPNSKEGVLRSGVEAVPVGVPQHKQAPAVNSQRRNRQVIPESGFEIVEQPQHTHPSATNAELEALRQEHQRIQDERQRLSRLQALDEEERRVRERIEQISSSGGGIR